MENKDGNPVVVLPEAVPLLVGETRKYRDTPRVPIEIDAEVRERLRRLLFHPKMHGVGYTEFVERAIDAAEALLALEVTP